MIRWPRAEEDLQLDRVRAADAGTADMLYTGRLRVGACGIQLFPVETLPHLRVWLCYGGWPDDAAEHRQYAVALEPTTSPWNSLAQALVQNAATVLTAGAAYEFDITFEVRPSGV